MRKFIIFGKSYLDHLLTEFTAYYNTARLGMVRDHLPPVRTIPDEVDMLPLEQIKVRT